MKSPEMGTGSPEQKELPRYKIVVKYGFDYGEDYPTQNGTEEVIVNAANEDDAKKIANDRVYTKWRNFGPGAGLEHISDDYTSVSSCELLPEKDKSKE